MKHLDAKKTQKIPCGGFLIGEGLELDESTKTLSTTGGGYTAGYGIEISEDGVISVSLANANGVKF